MNTSQFKSHCFAIALTAALVGCGAVGTLHAQVTEPIPAPTAPNLRISNLNSDIGYLRAKASPDECWNGLGTTSRYDFINKLTPATPCPAGQVPKVDQGYIWGQVLVQNQIFFGTFANPNCLGPTLNSTPKPLVFPGEWTCEYTQGPYSNTRGGPLPANLADDRPPRMYLYDIPSHTVRDITPKLGGTPPAAACGLTGANPFCVDALWFTTVGIRSAVSYTDPTTGKIYVIVSGQALVPGTPGGPAPVQNATNFFVWGVSENRWVGKWQYVGFSDMRHWLTYHDPTTNAVTLYGAVFKPSNSTTGFGALMRFTGSFAALPPVPVSSASNSFNAVPLCGSASTAAAPPVTAPTYDCVSFQDVGDLPTSASEVLLAPAGTADAGRVFVGTWPPQGSNPGNLVAGIFMSPVVPAGGFTPATPAVWTKVWDAGNYDPDPLLRTTYGTGAMSFYNGYLYWGTLNPPFSSVNKFFQTYPKPTDLTTSTEFVLQANRTAVLLRGQNFSTATPTVDLLYGETGLPVFTAPVAPATLGTWALQPNNIPTSTCSVNCGVPPLYGHSGFNNIFTNYMWTMALLNNRLYVGTMNWAFLANTYSVASNVSVPAYLQLTPSNFGAALYYFSDTTHPAIPVSTNGIGNYLNYGVRNMIPYSSSSLFLGMANPMNLATTSTSNYPGAVCSLGICRGGWELIEINPGSTVISR